MNGCNKPQITQATYLHTGRDGITRCRWAGDDVQYQHYHDHEWGRPTQDDIKLFEKMCLEGFQSGLSWLTILRKRENFRRAFAGFDFNQIIHFDEEDVSRLLQDAGIVRHRGKIEAVINNAHCTRHIVEEFGSLAAYIWQWKPKFSETHIGKGEYHHPIPSITQTSQSLSKDLKRRGWKFFGPTTAYAFMQAMGLVNDHMQGCAYHPIIERERVNFITPESLKEDLI